MAGEEIIESVGIEVSPVLNRAAVARFNQELRNATRTSVRNMQQSLKVQGVGNGPGLSSKSQTEEMRKSTLAAQREMRKLSRVFEGENKAFDKLQQQRNRHFSSAESQFRKKLSEGVTFQERTLGALRKQTQKMLQERGFQAGQAQKMAAQYSEFAKRQFAQQLSSGTGMDALAQHARVFAEQMEKKYGPALRQAGVESGRAGGQIQGMGRSMAAVSHIAIQSFAGGMYQAGTAISQIATRIGMTGFQLQMLGRQMTMFVTGPVALATGAIATFGIQSAAELERAAALMEGVVGNRGQAVSIMKGLTELAVRSPVFETGPLVEWSARMAGAGLEASKLVPTMDSLANVFMKSGVAPEAVSDALRALSQMMSKGKITGEEFNRQFLNAVPSGMKEMSEVAKILAKDLGMPIESAEDLIDLTKKGAVTMPQIMEGFRKLGQTAPYLAAGVRGAKTLTGVWQALKESMKMELGKQFLDPNQAFRVRPEIITAVMQLQSAGLKLIRTLGSTGAINVLITALTDLIGWVDKGVNRFASLSAESQKSTVQWVAMAAAAGPLVALLGIMTSTTATLLGPLGTVGIFLGQLATKGGIWGAVTVAAIAAVAGGFLYLWKTSAGFKAGMTEIFDNAVNRWNNWVAPAIESLRRQFVMLGRSLSDIGLDGEFWKTALDWILRFSAVGVTTLVYSLQAVVFSLRLITMTLTTLVGLMAQGAGWLGRWADQLKDINIPGMPKIKEKDKSDSGQRLIDWGQDAVDRGMEMGGLGQTFTDMTPTTSRLSDAVGGLGGAFSMMGNNAQTAGGKVSDLASRVEALRQKTQTNTSAVATQVQANDTWIRALDGARRSVEMNGSALAGNTVKAADNRQAVIGLAKASYDKMLVDVKSGVPMQEAINRHAARTKAMEREFGRTQANKAELQRLVAAYGTVPRNVETLMKMLGYDTVESKMKALWIQQQGLKSAGKITAKQAAAQWNTQLKANRFATGGIMPGYTPGRDVHQFVSPTGGRLALSGGEPIMRPEFGRAVGANWVHAMNRAARTGGVNAVREQMQQFAGGGILQVPIPIDVSQTMVKKEWADVGVLGSGGAAGAPGSYQKMFSWIKSRVPGTSLASGYRPGDPGYHGSGRAADLIFSDGSERRGNGMALKAFNLIKSTFMKNIKELIWDFAGSKAVWNGGNHFFTGSGAGPGTHNDHIHWAMDNGGWYQDGETAINTSGKPELNLNFAQAEALRTRIEGDDSPGNIQVFIGDRELTELVDIRVQRSSSKTTANLRRRKG